MSVGGLCPFVVGVVVFVAYRQHAAPAARRYIYIYIYMCFLFFLIYIIGAIESRDSGFRESSSSSSSSSRVDCTRTGSLLQ